VSCSRSLLTAALDVPGSEWLGGDPLLLLLLETGLLTTLEDDDELLLWLELSVLWSFCGTGEEVEEDDGLFWDRI